MKSADYRAAQAKYAVASRKDRGTSPEELEDLKRELAAISIAEYIEDRMRGLAWLTPQQNTRILNALGLSRMKVKAK